MSQSKYFFVVVRYAEDILALSLALLAITER
jgi:hypothetical protein